MGWLSWLFGEKEEEPPEPLVLGAKLRCPYGSYDSYLYVESGDIEVNNLPKACVEDCKALYNIQAFGDCYAGGFCEALMNLDDTWENPEPQGETVNGKEIITTKSLLSCRASGIELKIINSGQDGIFAKQLLLIREMDQKYPGLREILDNPYGSLYLNQGMYETAIRFIEDRMKQNGGKIETFTLYGKDNLEGEYIKGALGRLMPYCDTRTLENLVNGIETAGCKNGMDAATGWEANVINAEMIKMLRADCKETAEKIETKPFYRWQEENKLFSSVLAEGVTNFAYGAVMYYSAVGSGGKKPAAEETYNKGSGTKGAGNKKTNFEAENPMSGEKWNADFKSKYGKENVTWNTAANSMDDVLDMPSNVTRLTPNQLAEMAKSEGWSVGPLGKGGKAGIPFEQGGGFSMHYEDAYIQYHPGGGHHGALPYFKISTGKVGTVRYYINGEGVN
ncbi:PAAR-like protein [Lacrimispora sp.]|uniref:PAAR-like protein n=1 Tax=Lacrimispora sp. TaxID=2719234 RepID=UPI0039943206